MAIALPAGAVTRGRLRLPSLPNSSPLLMNWAAVSLVLGLVLLAAGLGRHLTPAPVDLGAGSVGEATQALGR